MHQPLTAPMPATVLKVLVAAGDVVKKGDAVVMLEAMKMELPLRAPRRDATVVTGGALPRGRSWCRPSAVLVELGRVNRDRQLD